MEIKIEFTGLDEFIAKIERRANEMQRDLKLACNKAAVEWAKEVKLRAPVETGLTRNTVLKNVQVSPGKIECQVGSNQKHAKFIEFGTQWIAGGDVLALGTDPTITDLQAVHTWAAKEGGGVFTDSAGKRRDAAGRFLKGSGTTSTSAMIDKSGGSKGRLRNAKGQFVSSRPQEQMPWLRPAFMQIRPKLLRWFGDVLRGQ